MPGIIDSKPKTLLIAPSSISLPILLKEFTTASVTVVLLSTISLNALTPADAISPTSWFAYSTPYVVDTVCGINNVIAVSILTVGGLSIEIVEPFVFFCLITFASVFLSLGFVLVFNCFLAPLLFSFFAYVPPEVNSFKYAGIFLALDSFCIFALPSVVVSALPKPIFAFVC